MSCLHSDWSGFVQMVEVEKKSERGLKEVEEEMVAGTAPSARKMRALRFVHIDSIAGLVSHCCPKPSGGWR